MAQKETEKNKLQCLGGKVERGRRGSGVTRRGPISAGLFTLRFFVFDGINKPAAGAKAILIQRLVVLTKGENYS